MTPLLLWVKRESQKSAALTDYDRLVAQGARLAVEREYRAAEKKLRKALSLNPGLPMAWYILGVFFHEIGDRASEADMFLDAMAKFPESSVGANGMPRVCLV